MKKLIVICVVALAGFAACRKQLPAGDFILEGKVGEWSAPAMAYFSYFTPEGEVVDSAVIDGGKFEFRGHVEWPAMARLVVDYSGEGVVNAMRKRAVKVFYIGEGVNKIASEDSLHNAVLTSAVNDQYEEYLAFVGGPVQDIAAKMNAKAAAASEEEQADTAFLKGLDREFRALHAERAAKQREYAAANPSSYFSVVALAESSSGAINPDEIEGILNGLDESLQEAPDVKMLRMRINALRNIGIDKTAPDFTQNTVDGRAVSLSDYRGKYVLLDFWASWCGPCRAESPYLVRAIKGYADKGFDVLGVSLDKAADRDAWIKAMEDDGYTWTNISDLKGWNNEAAQLYGVRAIPQNYLIDPQGVIVAQNLRGEKLLEYLEGLFN